MKRSITLIGGWLALVCLLCWTGRGHADDPDCSTCDCGEGFAWATTGDLTTSYVLTVYDPENLDKIGAAVTTARWKDADGLKNKVWCTILRATTTIMYPETRIES